MNSDIWLLQMHRVENSLLEAKKRQLNIVIFMWANTLIVEEERFPTYRKCTHVSVVKKTLDCFKSKRLKAKFVASSNLLWEWTVWFVVEEYFEQSKNAGWKDTPMVQKTKRLQMTAQVPMSAVSNSSVVAASFTGRLLLLQVDAKNW